MKYIDSEKLIAEIERRISICEKQRTDAIEVECYNLADDASARMGELRVILETITSLQQEQPETIGGVVHHALNVHWLVVNKKKLSARLKQFPEGTEVEILINARKEGAK